MRPCGMRACDDARHLDIEDCGSLQNAPPMSMPPGYYSTVFLLESPPIPLPSSFAIITAWNPMDEPTSAEENRQRDEKLIQLLELRQIPYFRATGCSPDLSHQEPGWAMEAEPEVALEIARRFRQRGLWQVEEDHLWLVDCGDGSRESLGSFQNRLLA